LEYPVPKGSINVRSSEDLDVKRQKRENWYAACYLTGTLISNTSNIEREPGRVCNTADLFGVTCSITVSELSSSVSVWSWMIFECYDDEQDRLQRQTWSTSCGSISTVLYGIAPQNSDTRQQLHILNLCQSLAGTQIYAMMQWHICWENLSMWDPYPPMPWRAEIVLPVLSSIVTIFPSCVFAPFNDFGY
jgi:hypothetical protein